MNDKIPRELLQKQALLRQKTVNIVLRAITELKTEGYQMKISNLIEHTGLSRSVFAKEHIRKVLIEYGIVADVKADNIYKIPKKKLSKLQKLKAEIKKKDDRLRQITCENTALENECELLRGRLLLLMQK